MITRTASPTPRTITALAAAVVFILAALGLRAEAQTDLDEARGRLDQVVARLEEGTTRREALQAELAGVLDRLGRARSELARVHGELGRVEAEVAALAAEMQRRQAALDRRAVSAYATRHGSVLDAILGAQSLGDVAYTLQILNEASQADHDHVVAVVHQRTQLERRQADLASLRAGLEANQAELERSAGDLAAKAAEEARLVAAMETDRAEAAGLVARLSDERDRAAAAERVAEAGGGAPASAPAPPPSSEPPNPKPPPSGSLPPDPGPAAVQAMIREDFAPLGADQVDIALCVADKESSFDPHAVNPVSGASGVYQFLPSTWESLSPAAGWGGASVFDAEANVAVAAWTVTNYGWGSWGPVAASCGA